MQCRRACWRAVDVAVVSTLILTMVPVHAADASGTDLTSAEVAAEIIRVQADADEAARRWADAELSAEALALEIETAGAAVAATTLEYAQLEGELSQIAIDRFTGRSNETILVLGGNAVEAMQRDALRAIALDAGAANADTVAAVQKGLTDQQRHLERLNAENARLVAVLAESQASLNAQLKDLAQLETRLKAHAFVRDAQVYRDLAGNLHADVRQNRPIARLTHPDTRLDTYVDAEGSILPLSPLFTARVATVARPGGANLPSAFFQDSTGRRYLEFLRYVDEHEFWKAQVSAVFIEPGGKLSFTQQVGDQRIEFGLPENISEKFAKLMVFYRQIPSVLGWDTYHRVNVEYQNQIICE